MTAQTHDALTWLEIGLGAVTFVSLFFVSAPYGRHARPGWGPHIPARVGWMMMESPALLAFAFFYLAGPHRFEPAPLALAALWFTHYFQRVVLYPMRMRSDAKPMPIAIAGMAILFNLLNASVNAPQLSTFGHYETSWLWDPRFLSGSALFFVGYVINLRADAALFRLRKPGDTGYRVPTGALHDLVANPNYFGEIVEWIGFAIATWSLAGTAFAIYTAANLVPRAISNLAWYRKNLDGYPRERRAVIPFVL
jgi:3-oxo-5-alpha-steroid 4-dehydrogenase 1